MKKYNLKSTSFWEIGKRRRIETSKNKTFDTIGEQARKWRI